MTDQIVIDRIASETISVPIVGTMPLIVHRFSEKAKRQMLDNMQGRKAPKTIRDPQADYEQAFYRLKSGEYGFPVLAFKADELIRSVRVTYREATDTEDAASVRSWHAVRDEDEYGYQPVEKIAEDPFAAKLVLRDMEREWKQLHRRYGAFAEFLDMVRGDLGEQAS